MKDPNISTVRNIIRYSSSHYYRQVLGVITAFIRPKLLTPELYGLWNLFKIIDTYADYIHFGSLSSMKYRIPFLESKNEHEKVRIIKGSALHGTFWIYLLFSIILILFSFKSGMSTEARVGLLAFSVIVIFLWYYEFYSALLKAYQNFILISRANYLYYTLVFFLSVVLIYFWGIYGVYLSVAVPLIVTILYFRSKAPLIDVNEFQINVFVDLIKHGFPIMFFDTVAMLIRTCDRFIVSALLGNEQLGYYGISIMVLGFIMNIPGASREVIEPKMMQSLNQSSYKKGIDEYFLKPLLNIAYIMPFLIGIVVFTFPIVIPLLLSRYTPGIVPSQILVIGGYFLALSYTVRGVVVANNWQLMASFIISFSLFANIVLSILFINFGFGISGVSIASSISFCILLVSLLIFVSKKSNYIAKRLKSNLFFLCCPFFIMCGSIFVLEYGESIFRIHLYVSAFLKLALFCLINLSLIFITRKKHTLTQKIKWIRQ
jgi:O-antigen/teichoic acid export membrane protein